MAETDLLYRVVTAVATAEGMDPAELDPLYNYINPAVLEELDDQEQGEWEFTFTVSDHQVTVTHESQVFIDGVPHSPDLSTQ